MPAHNEHPTRVCVRSRTALQTLHYKIYTVYKTLSNILHKFQNSYNVSCLRIRVRFCLRVRVYVRVTYALERSLIGESMGCLAVQVRASLDLAIMAPKPVTTI